MLEGAGSWLPPSTIVAAVCPLRLPVLALPVAALAALPQLLVATTVDAVLDALSSIVGGFRFHSQAKDARPAKGERAKAEEGAAAMRAAPDQRTDAIKPCRVHQVYPL